MTILFGICFVLYFLKLSAGHGYIDILSTFRAFLNASSCFVNSSTCSDVEYIGNSDSTESADEGAGTYEMPDDEICLKEGVSSPLQHEQATPIPLIFFGPHPKLSRGHEMYDIKKQYEMVQERKFVCTLGLFLTVFKTRCQTPGCTAVPTVKYHFVGMTLFVNSICSLGHKHKFCSSNEVNNVFVNNLQSAASMLLSGSHYAKMERFAKFLNLEFLSKTSYYRFQRLYLIPEVNEWWCWMRKELVSEFSGQDVVVSGDGQCDSPGFNAKNLCYFMVEVNSCYILDIEVLDKRHVGLISTNMEKEAVKRSLDRLQKDVKVVELVTDASTSIKALLGKLIHGSSFIVSLITCKPILEQVWLGLSVFWKKNESVHCTKEILNIGDCYNFLFN